MPNSVDVLKPFTGVWKTMIELKGESGEVSTHTATDTYRFAMDDKFVFHEVNGSMLGQDIDTLEIISARKDGSFDCRSYDKSGKVGDYVANLQGDRWTIKGDQLRFDGGFSTDRLTLSGNWEMRKGTDWRHWMSVTLRKEIG